MIITKDNASTFGLKEIEYKPSLFFKNHHVNTMYPYALRKSNDPQYKRERITTQDGDFLDLDYVRKGNDNIVILLHGLEGSTRSQYILGLTAALDKTGFDICAVNHRSCSGEMNISKTLYHSGYIDDLIEIVEYHSKRYANIHLVGYSLGGSMILNYLGRHQSIPSNVKSAVTFSVPIDLPSSAIMLNHWKNKAYTVQFLMTLNRKIIEKAKQHPTELNVDDYKNIKTLLDYDNRITAPLHGYKDAEDYYQRASSKPYLQNISIPTLLVNAHDDSFLAPPCFPYEIADGHSYFHFIGTKHGGHVGFASRKHDDYWSDKIVVDWLNGL
jgi:uncharacterized protein